MTPDPTGAPKPPPLPPGLLEPWRVIAVGAVAWVVLLVLAFTVPALESWRPISIAGLATGLLGTSVFLWQRSAARRGARGAQTGLTFGDDRS
ncbi:DUF2530 domain-containing protein [Mycolicibacterium mengxianglii]|uniref:DUF2530 domain-containing protein n=1 Tax=Mycolicibacterium mengxianglii TaxID=2736649 RepID=UPI0018D1F226|nr:DUF2530 domain-containing protein [Mycolicibacterium mengxianglii]